MIKFSVEDDTGPEADAAASDAFYRGEGCWTENPNLLHLSDGRIYRRCSLFDGHSESEDQKVLAISVSLGVRADSPGSSTSTTRSSLLLLLASLGIWPFGANVHNEER